MWNWQNVPETEHAALIGHYRQKAWPEIAKACERWGVSVHCCCNPEGLVAWFEYAIKNGEIKQDDTAKGMATKAGRDGGTDVG